ncbi:hypothetical protein E2C01_015190 [Portunus trituberculatus]|uniref:Uncharacterized protein n=1 Tax=Portunus trituberculatus TaxID=210409 RepID=A0A5B7DKN5_PORTR|nr:hypothetical protein [Portunus trituberculatus]
MQVCDLLHKVSVLMETSVELGVSGGGAFRILPFLPLPQGDPLGTETVWDQPGHRGLHVPLVRRGQVHLPVQAELHQGLSARPARPNKPGAHFRRDGDGTELPLTLGHGATHGCPLSTYSEAVGYVLHIAACDGGAVFGEESSSHLELAVRTIGIASSV